MSLVYVFVAICRRFNIAASATEVKPQIIAHVAPGGGLPDFWVDVLNSETRCILRRDEVLQISDRASVSPKPCTPVSSLVLQAEKIVTSVYRTSMASIDSQPSSLYPVVLALCLFDSTMSRWPPGNGIFPDIDLKAVLDDLLISDSMPPRMVALRDTVERYTR